MWYPQSMSTRRKIWKRAAVVLAAVVLLALLMGGYAMWMPGSSFEGPLPELTDAQGESAGRLRGHVEQLAGDIGARHVRRPEAYADAARYITETLEAAGYAPSFHDYEVGGESFRNVEVEVEGSSRAEELVIVGAHYDTAGPTPGADDNASGVAGTLELARRFADASPERTIRFVLFANEEPPYFQTMGMGSRAYAARSARRGEDITVMLSLEMLGYYSEVPSSQEYPFVLDLFYPDRGDFIAFVGNLANRGAVTRSIGRFRETTEFPSEGLTAPTLVPGVSFSDHWAFWQEGFPALMVTDTAFFRNPHYHQLTDTPDTLDYERMARVVDGIEEVVREWAE
jgi:Zn-dependent M28 family amino/carboxypeptidase